MLYDFYKGAENLYPWTNDPMLSGVKDCDTDVVNDCLMHLKYENTSDAIQNMYETGRVETQTRAFEQLKQMRHSTFDLSKFTVVGTPTITGDGIASGFSSANYLDTNVEHSGNVWSFKGKFKTPSSIHQNIDTLLLNYIPGSLQNRTEIFINYGKLACSVNVNGTNIAVTATGSYQIKANTEYYFKLEFTGSSYRFYYSLDGNDWVQIWKVRSTVNVYQTKTRIGNDANLNRTFTGSIDLKQFSITVDGKEVFSGNKTGVDTVKINDDYVEIPYTQSKTPAKIVDAVYRDRVIDLYEQQGLAGYYTIDEENKNFTLPMGEIYGMIESKGSSSYHPPLLSTIWSDHLLNDMSWLRADTFSWQDGNTYLQAYNELLTEYNDSTSIEDTEGDITFKRTPKGYKIALAEQETAITNKYNTDGIAWYYILDTENKKFKLPRTKWGFKGLRSNVGNDISESLPNIRGNYNANQLLDGDIDYDGAFTTSNISKGTPTSNSDGSQKGIGFNASLSSSTYQDGAPVQERATQMYLYFYVGEFTKSAEAQTAGLNAELLNGKLDVSNIKRYPIEVSDKSLMPSWYVVYSDGWIRQGGYNLISGTNVSNTISLLKNYKYTNYSIVEASFGATDRKLTIISQSVDKFTVKGWDNYAYWIAEGY